MRTLNAETCPRTRVQSISTPCVHTFQLGDKTLVFDVNSLQLMEAEEGDALTMPECGAYYAPVFPHYPDCRVRYLVLNVCHACNFDCSYCTLQQYEPGAAMMSLETAKKAISTMFPDPKLLRQPGDARLGFFGGEPLLNWKLIEEIVPYFEGLCSPRQPEFHVTTNGSLITKEKAEFLKEHNFSLIVSLDGPRHVHDACRKYPGGRGTFNAVMSGLAYLKEVGLSSKVLLRGTYSHASADTLLERVQFLNELKWKGYAGKGVSVEPAFLTESLCADVTVAQEESIGSEDLEVVREQYDRVVDWMVAHIRSGLGLYPSLHHVTAPLQRLLYCLPYGTECGAGKGYLTANGEGGVFACHREQSSLIGDLAVDGINERLRSKWLDNRIYARLHCNECYIRHVCGGGCRERSLGVHNDIRQPVDIECALHMIFFHAAVSLMTKLTTEELTRWIKLPAALQCAVQKPGENPQA